MAEAFVAVLAAVGTQGDRKRASPPRAGRIFLRPKNCGQCLRPGLLAVKIRSDTRDHGDRLYALDFLPVADEDTGTDSYLTIRAAAKSVAKNETTAGGELPPGAIVAVSTTYAKYYHFSLENWSSPRIAVLPPRRER